MKTTGKIMLSAFFIFLMVGAAYAGDDDGLSGANPPIWQIYKNGKAIHWVNWIANPRFAIYDPGTPNDLSDDFVLDKETGLVWQRSPRKSYEVTWELAHWDCNRLTLGKRMGWRLPTVEELGSLAEPTMASALALPPGHPFDVDVQSYWSATTHPFGPEMAWAVYFWDGVLMNDRLKLDFASVWCVRGGQGVDPQ